MQLKKEATREEPRQAERVLVGKPTRRTRIRYAPIPHTTNVRTAVIVQKKRIGAAAPSAASPCSRRRRGPPRGARFLAVCAPGGMDFYYADVAAHIPPPGAGASDVQAIEAASARHGVDVQLMSLYELVERYGVELS